ncbi:DUF1828 domain-containing protein [Gordonia terrae]|uniref:DUF1828 domain-containing protein n=1 Tax=Gordonia terrae TaxID=2055 RepID=UPI003F6B8735
MLNDSAMADPYRDGYLVRPNLHYSDGDSVEVFVERFSDGYRVSDRGEVRLRLQMAGVNLDSTRLNLALQQAISPFLAPAMTPAGEIAAFATDENLGLSIHHLGESMMRADQLRYLAPPPKSRPFGEQVVSNVQSVLPPGMRVDTRYKLRLRGGLVRRPTAAIHRGKEPLVFQAVSASADGRLEEASVEHCYFLFGNTVELSKLNRVAVLGDRSQARTQPSVESLSQVAQVAFLDDQSLHMLISEYLGHRPSIGSLR